MHLEIAFGLFSDYVCRCWTFNYVLRIFYNILLLLYYFTEKLRLLLLNYIRLVMVFTRASFTTFLQNLFDVDLII